MILLSLCYWKKGFPCLTNALIFIFYAVFSYKLLKRFYFQVFKCDARPLGCSKRYSLKEESYVFTLYTMMNTEGVSEYIYIPWKLYPSGCACLYFSWKYIRNLTESLSLILWSEDHFIIRGTVLAAKTYFLYSLLCHPRGD